MLSIDCNTVFGKLFIPCFKLTIMLSFILSFFAIVHLHEYLQLLSFILIIMVASVTCLLMAPICMIMSSLYDKSSKFSHNLSPKLHLVVEKKSRTILERQLKACPLIRCQVGNFYFMEAKAKLTVLHNVLNGTVFMMVNTKEM